MKRAVFLIGSAKPEGTSTSETLGRYLLERLRDGGVSTEVLPVSHMREGRRFASLLAAVDAADLFILCAPVYIDSLPSLVTHAFEGIAAHRQRHPSSQSCQFLALMNCGFPEAEHCRVALEICRVFSRQADFGWAGGLALGGGEAIHGQPLPNVGAMARRVRKALDLTATALLSGSAVPDEAVRMIGKPLLPKRVYTFFGNLGWRQQARRHGVGSRLGARPFETKRAAGSRGRLMRGE